MFPDLKAGLCADKADRTSLLIHGFCLGKMRIVFVGTTSSIHLLMKHVTESEYASMSCSISRTESDKSRFDPSMVET